MEKPGKKFTIGDFFEPMVLTAPPSAKNYLDANLFVQAADAFSRTTNQCVYIIDYYKQGFLYVSDHPLFLCGKSAGTILKQGYFFYFQNVPADDLEMLLKINEAGFKFYRTIPLGQRLNYSISYDFHLIQSNKRKILVNHQLTPLALDEASNIWLALCVVTLSSNSQSGNVVIVKKGSSEIYKYDIVNNKWCLEKRPALTKQEKEVLAFSMQGNTINEIADKLQIALSTAKFHRKNILRKFNVRNISEAVAFAATNNIF